MATLFRRFWGHIQPQNTSLDQDHCRFLISAPVRKESRSFVLCWHLFPLCPGGICIHVVEGPLSNPPVIIHLTGSWHWKGSVSCQKEAMKTGPQACLLCGKWGTKGRGRVCMPTTDFSPWCPVVGCLLTSTVVFLTVVLFSYTEWGHLMP